MVDDAFRALFDVPLAAAEADDPLLASAVVDDTDLAAVAFDGPLTVRVTGGAGQLAGPAAMAERRGLDVTAYETSVRDLDDPAGAVRRIVAAADAAGVTDRVVVVLPEVEPGYGWLAAADEVAAVEMTLGLPAGPAFEAWVEAALDRETALRVTTTTSPRLLLETVLRVFDGGLESRADDAPDLRRARRWLTSVRATSTAEHATSPSASQA